MGLLYNFHTGGSVWFLGLLTSRRLGIGLSFDLCNHPGSGLRLRASGFVQVNARQAPAQAALLDQIIFTVTDKKKGWHVRILRYK